MGNLPIFIYLQRSRVNLHSGQVVNESGQVFLSKAGRRVLRCLVENAGNLVLTDDLMTAGWGRDKFVDPNNLNQAIGELRKTFGFDLIQNVPSKGYLLTVLPTVPSDQADGDKLKKRKEIDIRDGQSIRNRIERSVPLSTLLWHLPEPRNPLFKGRERELEDLHRESLDKAGRRVVQVLAALRGLGASSLAVEYAYRFREQYDLVWWFDATSPAEVTKQYDVLAKNFDRSYSETNLDAIDYVSNRLANFPNWLIIFDNAISAEDIARLLPRTGVGHIIVTATDRNWGGNPTIYDVLPLDHAEAVSFLNARLTGLQSNSDRELIPELATELQCMPLALEVASAYIEITHCTISAYLDRLRTLRAKSDWLFQFDRSVEVLVAETWRLTLARAQCESPGVFVLLRVVSWFDDCEIPLNFITELQFAERLFWGKLRQRIMLVLIARYDRRKLPAPKPSLPSLRRSRYLHTFTEALGRLRQYSVATQSESGFMILPLAKLVGRSRQFRFTKLTWLRGALIVGAFCAWGSIDRTELRSLALWARHIRRAIQHAKELAMLETDEALVWGTQTLECIEQKLADPTCTPRLPPEGLGFV